jgi:hypothetical protein
MALYWDKVLSIVPSGFLQNPQELSPSMRVLVREGVVEQLVPGYYFTELMRAREPFLNYVQARLARSPRLSRIGGCRNPARIHMEKLSFISDDLEQLSLIRRSSSHPWFNAVPWVATSFMAYLAGCLGQIGAVNAWPVTDDRLSMRIIGGLGRSSLAESARFHAPVRDVVLKRVLPGPQDDFDCTTLIRFKSTHRTQLHAFRNRIESLCTELASTHDPLERSARTEAEAERLREEANALAESMRGSWKRVIFRDVLPVLAAATATVADPLNPLAIVSGATSLGNAVYQFIASQRDRRQQLRKPLAYAVLAHHTWPQRQPPRAKTMPSPEAPL